MNTICKLVEVAQLTKQEWGCFFCSIIPKTVPSTLDQPKITPRMQNRAKCCNNIIIFFLKKKQKKQISACWSSQFSKPITEFCSISNKLQSDYKQHNSTLVKWIKTSNINGVSYLVFMVCGAFRSQEKAPLSFEGLFKGGDDEHQTIITYCPETNPVFWGLQQRFPGQATSVQASFKTSFVGTTHFKCGVRLFNWWWMNGRVVGHTLRTDCLFVCLPSWMTVDA